MSGSLPVCSCRIMLSTVVAIITVSRKLVIHYGYLDIASLDVLLQNLILYFLNFTITKREFSGIFCLSGDEFPSSKREFPVDLCFERNLFWRNVTMADNEYCDNNLASLLCTFGSAIVIIWRRQQSVIRVWLCMQKLDYSAQHWAFCAKWTDDPRYWWKVVLILSCVCNHPDHFRPLLN